MDISDFTELLAAARQQPEPQRLLLVFAAAESSDGDGARRGTSAPDRGGALAPVLCTDKLAAEIRDFASLEAESARTGIGWDILFIASLPGRAGFPPGSDEAEQPLRMMVDRIRSGQIARFVTVDRRGQCVRLQPER